MSQLPVEEKYNLGTQMRRAAVSVSNNIGEGQGRWYCQVNAKFCRTSRGSVGELIDDFYTRVDEIHGDPRLVDELKAEATQQIARTNSDIAYLRRSKKGDQPEAETT
jgi:four helix bundle protein